MSRIVVRHSEIKDGRQCPLKHRLRWIDGWVSPTFSDASLLGTAWHAVLQARYETIRAQQQRLGYVDWRQQVMEYPDSVAPIDEATYAEALEWTRDLSGQQHDTLTWMIDGYIERFGADPDWEVLLVEADPTVPLVEPSGKPSKRFSLQIHVDLAVQDWSMGGKVLTVDHKSTAQPLGQHDVDLDDQFGLYMWALWRLGYDVLAPVCNQAKTKILQRAQTIEERFVRINSYRSQVEMTNIAADALRTAKRLYSAANLEEPDSAPNPRTCGWSCEFKEVHLQIRKSPFGRDVAPAALIARGFTREDGP